MMDDWIEFGGSGNVGGGASLILVRWSVGRWCHQGRG